MVTPARFILEDRRFGGSWTESKPLTAKKESVEAWAAYFEALIFTPFLSAIVRLTFIQFLNL